MLKNTKTGIIQYTSNHYYNFAAIMRDLGPAQRLDMGVVVIRQDNLC